MVSSSQEIETNMAKISRMFSEFEEVALYSFRDEDVILEDEDEKEKEQEDPENIIVTTKKVKIEFVYLVKRITRVTHPKCELY